MRRHEVFTSADELPAPHMIFRVRPCGRTASCRFRLASTAPATASSNRASCRGSCGCACFTMNDAHLYCAPEQLKEEIVSLLKMYRELYELLEYERWSLRLSLHDPSKEGEVRRRRGTLGQRREDPARDASTSRGWSTRSGWMKAAFYAAQIDIQFKNLMGEETVPPSRWTSWRPGSFELRYTDERGEEQPPS